MSRRKRAPESQIGRSRGDELISDHCTSGTASALIDSEMHRPFGSWSPFDTFGITQTSDAHADINEISTSAYGNALDVSADIALNQPISLS
jgi:hypothetical protein